MSKPHITQIDIRKFQAPFSRTHHLRFGQLTHSATVFVRVYADNGLYGTGEASPDPWITGETQDICFAAARYLAPHFLDKNPLALSSRNAELDVLLLHNSSTRSAFDMALYDLAAKQAGLPLYAYLEGKKRTFSTHVTLWLDTPDATAETARVFVDQGVVSLKIKVGTRCEEDVARVRAVRGVVEPDPTIRIDAN